MARLFSLFLLYNVNVFTLTAIAFDRKDALKNFEHQRKLNSTKTKFLILGIWLLSFTATIVSLFGEILKSVNLEQHPNVCPAYRPLQKRVQSFESKISSITSSSTISIFSTTCCCYILGSFMSLSRHIRNHRNQMEEKFGTRRTASEVEFTSKTVALTMCYLLTWATLGVFNILRKKILTKQIMCAYMWALSSSYLSFVVIPTTYMVLDRRFRFTIRKLLGCFLCTLTYEARARNSCAVTPAVLATSRIIAAFGDDNREKMTPVSLAG